MQNQEIILICCFVSVIGHILLSLAAYKWALNDSVAYKVKPRGALTYEISHSRNYAIWFFVLTFIFSFGGFVIMLLHYLADKSHILASMSSSGSQVPPLDTQERHLGGDNIKLAGATLSTLSSNQDNVGVAAENWICKCRFENKGHDGYCIKCKRAKGAIV